MAQFAPLPPAAQLDYTDQDQVVRYMRELLSLAPLLSNGFDYEWARLWKLLKPHYSQADIRKMEQVAATGTLWERAIPPNIPEVGDRKEYNTNKGRWIK